MKKSIIVIFQLLFAHSLFAQMIAVNAGPNLMYDRDFNYRMSYTHTLSKKLDIGAAVHYVGYKDNLFINIDENVAVLQYRGVGDNPLIWYDEFTRGLARENVERENNMSGSFSLQEQVFHVGLFVQYNITQNEKWNFGFRIAPNLVVSRGQFYAHVMWYGEIKIAEDSEEVPIVFYAKEVTNTVTMSVMPSIYANYKLTENFWLGLDYSMPVYIVGNRYFDMLPSASVSYLF